MTIVNTGNTLNSELIQPGITLISDGFGLVTASATYKCDWATAVPVTQRGEPLDFGGLTYLKAHKSSTSYDNLQYKTVKVDYVGIDPAINAGNRTNANTSAANGLTAENITSHPNFFFNAIPFAIALAGLPPYVQDDPDNLAPNVNGAPAYLGANGTCFEKANGGRFIGFVNPAYPSLYGKTQYLATTTTYTGVVYYNNVSFVQGLLALLNTATSTRSWGSEYPLLPDWAPFGTTDWGHKNLLSQVNVEEFGSLYKVNYEIRYAKEGWDNLTYINIAGA
jgi:hypothetical protein